MASLPQPSDQDWDMTVERGSQPAASADESSNHDDSQASGAETPSVPTYEDVPPVTVNEDDTTTEVTEPSASEEQLPEAVS